ncbi:MAG: Hpt domain-containing protein, partial [Chloroflexi bacterium]|nr:Hpt domain-containing protein [Chloroflexota bacterium]
MEQVLDVSSEELKVFLQEVDEQLQLLDEDIIRLEKEEDNVDLLQEIFRAAHTLKGSSSMLGFHKMADLTHVMEDVLDRLRKGLVQVTPELIDALLASLDELKILKQAISSGGDDSAGDIVPLVAMLKNVVQSGEEATSSKKKSASISSTVLADPAIQKKLKKVAAAGSPLYMIQIAVDPESAWAAVRFFQALNELGMLGEIICSDPSQEEIEQEKAGAELQVLLATAADADAVRAAVSSIEDITKVEVAAWPGADAASDERVADQEAGGDDTERRVIDLGPTSRGKSQREQLELASQKIETLQTVRIEVEQLDALLNVVGELVTERTRVSAISRVLELRYRGDESVQSLAGTCDRLGR